MIRSRTKKILLGLFLAAVLAGWSAVALAPAVLAAGEGQQCSTNDDCDSPLSCRSGRCTRINTFRLVPECATVRSAIPGEAPPVPSITCALETFGRIAQLILGLTGSAALLMFVYGGFLMVTSAGSSDKVSKGKTVMTNAIIGIVIIMTSGLLIQYGISKIGISSEFQVVGQACTGTGGRGVIIQMPNGENKCVSSCATDLAASGFSCVNTTLPANAGKYCIANLCPGNADIMCCLTQ
ncbi:MAG: pilin [Patescibacteria group bacterium]|jgi:hypothetical protein